MNIIKWTVFSCSMVLSLAGAQAQEADPILFSVQGKPVHVSEFDYIYKKTNGQQADYSKASLEEYLDLYVKFKLKVQRAKDMKMDTIATLARELEGYRRQLADTYLVDREVTDKLIAEVYQRMAVEREVYHILLKIKPNATTEDSAVVLDRAQRILEMLKKGGDFSRMAKGQSEDASVMENGGNIGFMTSMLPQGFYALENAIYTTPVGQVYPELVYSPMGIHIVKVQSERAARGEVEVAHVLVRDPENVRGAEAEKKIREAYAALRSGKSFEEVVTAFSEDRVTAAKGGYLGFFGINRYEHSFEDAAFGLAKDGDFSEPVRTRLGWHIIKRLSRKDLESLSKIRTRLQSQITQDSRFELAKHQMIDRIKSEGHFTEDAAQVQAYYKTLDAEFLSYKWKPAEDMQPKFLFGLGDSFRMTTADFSEFLLRNQRKRLQMARDTNVMEVATTLYHDFVNESCIKYEETKLEKKYPEFKALMREYEEGILLFEATKMLVWDKASQDAAGLEAYHNKHRNNYMWDTRAKVVEYRLQGDDAKLAAKVHKYATGKSMEKTLKKFNKKNSTILNAQVKYYEKSAADQMGGLPWQEGYITGLQPDTEKKQFTFSKVEEIMEPTPKSLAEARGYIIADYQDHLEKEWVSSLKSMYKVEVNQQTLNALTKTGNNR